MDICTIERNSQVIQNFTEAAEGLNQFLLQMFQSIYSFWYFKGLDIWIAFVVNKSMVLTLLFVLQDIQYLEVHHVLCLILWLL
jgi:hypothetical protein